MTIGRVLAALALAGLVGCTPEPATPQKRAWVQVPIDQVVTSFDEICLASAPDFVGATDRMERQGLTEPGLNGAFFLPGGGMSAKVATLPQSRAVARERCSVVFNTDNPAQTQADAEKAVTAALSRRSLVPDGPPADARVGQRSVRIWTLTIDGRAVRLSLLESLGPRIPAALLLDVTASTGAA
ncbi:MAG: hypothetical protein AAGB15_06740 [Pseudomonadota bacterium]